MEQKLSLLLLLHGENMIEILHNAGLAVEDVVNSLKAGKLVSSLVPEKYEFIVGVMPSLNEVLDVDAFSDE